MDSLAHTHARAHARDGGETANKTKSVMWAKFTCWDVTCPLLEPKLAPPPPPPWWSGNVETS